MMPSLARRRNIASIRWAGSFAPPSSHHVNTAMQAHSIRGDRYGRPREGFPLQGHRTSQRGGRNPARVTVTSRRTAALDGRPAAAESAWRQ